MTAFVLTLLMAAALAVTAYAASVGDRNSSAIINAEKWAATQAIIWELICEYRSAYTYDDWGYSPFYDCVDTSRYPTFELWYSANGENIETILSESFRIYLYRELQKFASGSDHHVSCS